MNTLLAGYPKSLEFAFEFMPLDPDVSDSRPRRTDAAELNEFVQGVSFPLGDDFNAAIRAIPCPTSYPQLTSEM